MHRIGRKRGGERRGEWRERRRNALLSRGVVGGVWVWLSRERDKSVKGDKKPKG